MEELNRKEITIDEFKFLIMSNLPVKIKTIWKIKKSTESDNTPILNLFSKNNESIYLSICLNKFWLF